jgi:flagella basal body P-ring formation protein FlgA
MKYLVCLGIAVALTAAGQCVEVAGDRIRAGDLASSVPEFSHRPPEAEVAISPLPGSVRHLRAVELSRVLGSPVKVDICVVRMTRTLTADEISAAMRSSIPDPSIRLSVVDYSHSPVPPGAVEFPLSGLAQAATSSSPRPITWRGRVRYDAGRTAAVWATVRISVPRQVLVARRQVRAGEAFASDDVEEKTIDYASLTPPQAIDLKTLTNSETSRDVPAGAIIERSMLRSRAVVRKGDTIRVAVKSPGAELRFDAPVVSAARIGDRVLVRNPLNGRMVSAVVRGAGEAVIDLGGKSYVQ